MKPKLLLLTPRYPYPVIGGDRLRVFQIAKALANEFNITLLSLCETDEELNTNLPEGSPFTFVHKVKLSKLRSIINCFFGIFTRIPLQIHYYTSANYARLVSELIPSHDVVIAHLIRTGHYIEHCNIPKVLEMTDAISMNYERIKNSPFTYSFKSIVFRFEQKRLSKYEKKTITNFDVVSFVSKVDRDYLYQDLCNDNSVVATMGVDPAAFPKQDLTTNSNTILFIGNMSTLQNLDACKYFLSEVFPLIKDLYPKAVFRIVGKMDLSIQEFFQRHDCVQVMANVKSISDCVEDVGVAVAPMRLGAGIQTKILEYMSLGFPVVTSSIGYEGLNAVINQDIFVADEPARFAKDVVELLINQYLRSSVSSSACQYVAANHSWAAAMKPLSERVHSLIREV